MITKEEMTALIGKEILLKSAQENVSPCAESWLLRGLLQGRHRS